MSGFFDEPEDYSNLIPDEVTLQLRLPTGLAYAFTELARAYKRLGDNADEAKEAFIQMLTTKAAHT